MLDDGTLVPAGSFLGGDDDVDVALWAATREGDTGQFVIVITEAGELGGALDDSYVIFRAPLP